MSSQQQPALVIARQPKVVESVQASAAAVGRAVEVVTDAETVRQRWRAAPVVLVGAECAAMVVACALPVHPGVHVVAPTADEAVAWSAPLQAPVVVLPEGSGLLTGLLAGVGERRGSGRVVAVCGASGGVGVSSLVAGLAQVAARTGLRTAAVELASHSGGLDLLMGVEQQPGWRWPDLASASGHVGALSGRVPRAAEVDLVSVGRSPVTPGQAAVMAVVEALTRSHALVLVDAGRCAELALPAALVGRTLLVVGADVRSVVAARSRLAAAALEPDRLAPGVIEVVVRCGRDRRLAASEVGRALSLPVLGRVRDDRGVPQALEAGDQPARRARSSFGRDCAALVDRLAAPADASGSSDRPFLGEVA
ncbi:septum site-determining protein Ssd [Aestuariimicrobium soli]|uniref:septum site-determining protein Ssd n=1 Tax=Aestuariimicrobium soli TaxID=2035834 RepID=UPI003EB9033D